MNGDEDRRREDQYEAARFSFAALHEKQQERHEPGDDKQCVVHRLGVEISSNSPNKLVLYRLGVRMQ